MAESSLIAPNTKLTLKLSWTEIAPEYEKAANRLAKRVRMDGFRKGKVPAKMAAQMVGHEALVEAALEKILPEAYSKLIAAEKKQPLTQPDIKPVSIKKGEDWELSIEIAERPEIKLGDYKSVVKKALKEALKEVAEAIKAAEPKTESAPTEKTAKTKKTEKADGEKSVETPVSGVKPPTEAEQKDMKLRHILGGLVSEVKPAIPELLVRSEARRDLDQLVKTLEQMQMTLDDYLARRGQKFEQFSGELAGTALGRLQIEFVLQAIRDAEKIEATDEDVAQKIAKIEDDHLREHYQKDAEYRDYMKSVIAREKTLDMLLGE